MENLNSERDTYPQALQSQSTTQNQQLQASQTAQIDPEELRAAVSQATCVVRQQDGTIIWSSERYFFAASSTSDKIVAKRRFPNDPIPTDYNTAFWTAEEMDDATKVILYQAYFRKYPYQKTNDPLLPEGVTRIEKGEHNFLMLAVRLNEAGINSKNPVSLAQDLRNWNVLKEPFPSYNDWKCYYVDPILVSWKEHQLPRNQKQYAAGRNGNIGELSIKK